MIEVIILTTSSIILIGVCSILCAVSYLYYRPGKQATTASEQGYKEAQRIIQESLKRAHTILETALARSQTITRETESLKRNLESESNALMTQTQREYAQLLHEILSGMDSAYKETASKFSTDYILHAQKTLKMIEEKEERELDTLESVLQDEVSRANKKLEKRTDDEFKKVKNQLDEYKKSQIEKIDTSIQSLIRNVFFEFSKNISALDHEELILQALERAKKDNFFEENDTTSQAKNKKTS